jgi:pimeloyl-ACP methyl ester carboxylesterase
MSWRLAVLLGIVAVVVGLAGWSGWLLFKRPLDVFAWQGRLALRRAGFKAVLVPAPAGPQRVYVTGAGAAVVLLHGAGDSAATWRFAAPALLDRHRVVVPDLAGHGGSAPASGTIDVGMILSGVEATLDTLAPSERVTLVGNSLGAWVAMLYASRHPERVERVVCVNGGAVSGHNEDARVLPKTREEARAAMAQVLDPGSPRVPDFVLDDVVRQARVGSLARFAASAPTMREWVLDGKLGAIKTPVSLLWGASDQVMPLDYARRIAAELPSAELLEIPRCGHVPQIECPQAFLAALRPLLGARP